MRTFLFISLLILGAVESIYSQSIIRGTVKDSFNQHLPNATIQVLDSLQNDLLAYSITDLDGNYTIKVKENGTLFIKASFLGFEAMSIKIKLQPKDSIDLDFHLKESSISLGEVFIKYDGSLAEVKKDSIIYNLNNLTTGQENNLKDILNKLPGAEIDEYGKVKINGKQVEHLLIDGDAFFANQHQLATENISADMVAGITFFNKYEDFSHIEGAKSNATALNISIKEEYRNRITGNIETLAGVKNKYEAHTNLFRFGGKLKLTFIGDINNTGKEAISYNDYIQLNSGVGQFSRNKNSGTQTRTIKDSEIPKFLHSSLDVAKRDLQLSALNFTYSPSKKFKLSGFNILNKASQKQMFSINRFYLNMPDANHQENKDVFGDFFFNTTVLHADYKWNNNSVLNYTFNYNFGKDNQKSVVHNEKESQQNMLNQSDVLRKYNLGQEINLTKRLGQNSLLSIRGILEFFKNTGNLGLEANRPFLGFDFEEDSFLLTQEKIEKQNKYGVLFQLERDTSFGNITISGGSTFYQEKFHSYLNNEAPDFLNNLERDKNDSYLGMDFFYPINPWLSIYGSLSYHHFTFDHPLTGKSHANRLFPSAGFTANINETNQLNFTYTYDKTFTELEETLNNSYIENYLSSIKGSGIASDEIFPEHQFDLNYYSNKLSSGTSLFVLFNYTKKPKNIIFNSRVRSDDHILKEYALGNSYEQILSTVSYKKSFRKAKLSVASQSTFFHLSYENFIDTKLNNTRITSIKENLGLQSNYKTACNFSTGIEFNYTQYSNSIHALSSSTTRINPYFNLTGYHKEGKIYWGLDLSYKTFKSNSLKRNFFQLDPSINFLSKDKKWNFYLQGKNILNLDSPEISQIISTTSFYEERLSRSLEGYLGLGVNYNF